MRFKLTTPVLGLLMAVCCYSSVEAAGYFLIPEGECTDVCAKDSRLMGTPPVVFCPGGNICAGDPATSCQWATLTAVVAGDPPTGTQMRWCACTGGESPEIECCTAIDVFELNGIGGPGWTHWFSDCTSDSNCDSGHHCAPNAQKKCRCQ